MESDKEILNALKKAFETYKKDVEEDDSPVGMCYYIRKAFNAHYNYGDLSSIIPEFNVENPDLHCTTTNPYFYWWSVDDFESRTNAFNYLIQIYNDKIRINQGSKEALSGTNDKSSDIR